MCVYHALLLGSLTFNRSKWKDNTKITSKLKRKVQVIIPMAGKSQRFFDAGYKKPKGLIEFFDLPMIAHILKVFKDFDDILVIISEEDDLKFDLVNVIKRYHSSVKISKIGQHSFGPSYSVLESLPFISLTKKIIVHYCDFSGVWDPEETVNLLDECDGVLLSFVGFHPVRVHGTKFAYGRVNHNNQLLEIKEKGSFTHKPEDEKASSGVYGFSSGELMIQAIKKQVELNLQINGEFYTSLTLEVLLRDSHKILTQNMQWFYGWGTPEDLELYVFYLRLLQGVAKIQQYNSVINHNGIILAAGKSSRLRFGGEKPKQSKLIFNAMKLIDFSKNLITTIDNTFLITTEEIYPENIWNLPKENFKVLTHATESQLASVNIGLDLIKDKKIPITFLASDNIILINKISFTEILSSTADLIVWTSSNFPLAKVSPNQYSWVKVNDDNTIEDAVFKESPKDLRNWKLISGNFTFRNHSVVKQLIRNLESKLDDSHREPILDDLVGSALSMGLNVRAFDVAEYVTLGSDLENKVFDYFSGIYEFNHQI